MSGDLYFVQQPVGEMANFAYLVGNLETRECLLVDPAWARWAIWLRRAEADEMRITGALVTHYHPDHVGGARSSARKSRGWRSSWRNTPAPSM